MLSGAELVFLIQSGPRIFASMLPYMDPDVTKKAREKFSVFKEFAGQSSSVLLDGGDTIYPIME